MKRLGWEIFKIIPYLAFVLGATFYFGDSSQISLTLYYLAVITLSILVFHVGRKFMYPTVSIEEYCASAYYHRNVAAALIVVIFFVFQMIMVYLSVLCITATIK